MKFDKWLNKTSIAGKNWVCDFSVNQTWIISNKFRKYEKNEWNIRRDEREKVRSKKDKVVRIKFNITPLFFLSIMVIKDFVATCKFGRWKRHHRRYLLANIIYRC